MKELTFRNQAGTVVVTYKTDLLGTAGAFTVHKIAGLESVPPLTVRDKLLLKTFQHLTYTVDAFIRFAKINKLQLTVFNQGTTTTLVGNFSDSASDSGS
jgi:hypothetical protein